MNCSEIIKILSDTAPEHFAEDWDNTGLLIETTREIKKVIIAVDATDYVIDKAVSENADLIITHHPLIFSGLKRLTINDNHIGRRVLKLANNNIGLYAMHTNFDVCQMNKAVCDKLQVKMTDLFEITDEWNGEKVGFGFNVSPEMMKINDIQKLAEFIKDKMELDAVRVFASTSEKQEIKQISIIPGSGKSFINELQDNTDSKIKVFITGDIDHHTGIDAAAKGYAVIDAGHYGIEKVFVEYMEKYISSKLANVEVLSVKDDAPFKTI